MVGTSNKSVPEMAIDSSKEMEWHCWPSKHWKAAGLGELSGWNIVGTLSLGPRFGRRRAEAEALELAIRGCHTVVTTLMAV